MAATLAVTRRNRLRLPNGFVAVNRQQLERVFPVSRADQTWVVPVVLYRLFFDPVP